MTLKNKLPTIRQLLVMLVLLLSFIAGIETRRAYRLEKVATVTLNVLMAQEKLIDQILLELKRKSRRDSGIKII
jgi:hypothetical protein